MSSAIPAPPFPPPPGPVPSGAARRGPGRRAMLIALAVFGLPLLFVGAMLTGHGVSDGTRATISSAPSPSAAPSVPPLGSFSGHRVHGFPEGWRRWTLTDGTLSIMAPPYPILGGDSVESQSAAFQGDDAMWLTVLTIISADYPSVRAATVDFPSSLGDPERIHVNGVLGLAYSFRSEGNQVEMWVFVVDGDFYEIVGRYPFGSPTTPTARDEAKLSLDSLELSGSSG